MSKCRCEESRTANPRWRRKDQKPHGQGFKYKIVCLSCGYEWWSDASYTIELSWLTPDEKAKLEYPSSDY